jgi:hypothetical protein
MAEGSYRRKTGRYWIEVREKALAELAELRAERDIKESELEILNQEIVRLEQAVAGLSPLASDGIDMMTVGIRVEGIANMGLADACREILKQSPSYRTARGIRDSLRDSSYNLEQHTNPLASIHGVLKRFVEAKEIEQLETEGKTRYRWKGETVQFPDLSPVIAKMGSKLSDLGTQKPRRGLESLKKRGLESLKKKD